MSSGIPTSGPVSFSQLKSATGRVTGIVSLSDIYGSHITVPKIGQRLTFTTIRGIPAAKPVFQALSPGVQSNTLGLYATRLLNKSYTGPIMDIKRLSDNATTNVYSDFLGNLKTTSGDTISNWGRSTTLEITKWYDQSGGARHATATTKTAGGKAPQLTLDPTGTGKYCVYFPNSSASTSSYYGFTIASQNVQSMMCTFYSLSKGALTDQSLLCTNTDNYGVRFYSSTLTTGNSGDFLNGGGFSVFNGTYSSGTVDGTVLFTYTNNTWNTFCANRTSTTMAMVYIGNCEPTFASGSLLPRCFYGYMTDLSIFGSALSTVGLTSKTIQSDLNTLMTYAPMSTKMSISSGLIGHFTADSWTGSQWRDLSGSGNHVTTFSGTISVTSQSNEQFNGKYLTGTTLSTITWPNTILPSSYTLFHIARYNGANKGRIFTGSLTNWLSGYYFGAVGVAYHGAFITPGTDLHGNNWVLSSDQMNLYRSQMAQRSTINGSGSAPSPLTVNQWQSGEKSDWAIACVMVYNRVMSAAEYIATEEMLAECYKMPFPIRDGLTLDLDPLNYTSGSTSWNDRSGNGYNMTVTASTYTTSGFNGGTSPYFNIVSGSNVITYSAQLPNANYNTVIIFCSVYNNSAIYRTLLRGTAIHQALTNQGTNNLGFFNGSFIGFTPNIDVSTLPGAFNRLNMWVFHFATTSPYVTFYLNPSKLPLSALGTITNASASFTEGIKSIANHPTATQPFGNIGNVFVYHRKLADEELVEIYTRYQSLYGLPKPVSYSGNLLTTITVQNSGSTLTSWPVKVTLPYKTGYAANFQDLRFVESSTGTIVNHWFETVATSSSATVWLQVPQLTGSTYLNGAFIDVYNGFSSSTGNGKNVFSFFDNFTTAASLDTTLWNTAGTVGISGGALSFTTTAPSYIVSKLTQSQMGIGQDIVLETSVNSASINAIPEIAIRSSTSTNNGIKGRMDCRGGVSMGRGGIFGSPFNNWQYLNTADTVGMPTNTTYTFKFVGGGNNFSCYLNDVQYGTTFTSSLAAYNTDGSIALINHNGFNVIFYWVRAYKYTSQTLTVTVT